MARNSSISIEIPCGRVARGTASVPGSKSLTQRALVVAALARGRSRLRGGLDSDDSRALRSALRRLGVVVRESRAGWTVRGTGGALRPLRVPLRVGNAGTAMRFLTALVALGEGHYVVDGDRRMRQRPIADLIGALRQLGVEARGARRNRFPPVEIRAAGGLRGGTARLSGAVSSQYLSALLMVAPLAGREVRLRVTGRLVSAPYVNLTLAVMRAFGVRVAGPPTAGRRRPAGPSAKRSLLYRVSGGQRYRPRTYDIEGDASSASYFLAAAALTGGRVRISNLDAGSAQGDAGFIDLLERMGCAVIRGRHGLEAVAPPGGVLRGIDADMSAMPDVVPTLAAVALFARTPTRIRGAAHLRVKESDRLRALRLEIRRLGGACRETRDGLIITPRPLRGALIRTYNDHRMAMAFALVGLRVPGVRIQNPSCVSKSFPGYFAHLFRLLKTPSG